MQKIKLCNRLREVQILIPMRIVALSLQSTTFLRKSKAQDLSFTTRIENGATQRLTVCTIHSYRSKKGLSLPVTQVFFCIAFKHPLFQSNIFKYVCKCSGGITVSRGQTQQNTPHTK